MRQCEIYLHGIKCGLLTEEDDKSFTVFRAQALKMEALRIR